MFNMGVMEFFTAGINPPPSTPLIQSPVIEPQRAVTPTISVLDIDDTSGEVHHHHFGVASRDKVAIVTYVAKKRAEFPPSREISTCWSVPRPPFVLDPHVNTEDVIYIRFSPERPVFSMPPPAYNLIPHHFIKVAIDGLWADNSHANPQRLLIVCKAGTHLTTGEIHSRVLDAANRIMTQCRSAVEPKGKALAGFEMSVPEVGLIDEMDLDMVKMVEEGVEMQCTAIWN
ncbi:hypothetical protein B9Z19DRAFT_1191369 [Tuber borchii]|uniref:Uncharacterized protein n=1 Tax=Tuber borchii TaxID=42251 RepID=A0A2T7A0D7_TUBBO|nr:hypothetical protein B9Z19DRAFT_1191369 [Tuber borchii]